MRIGDHSSTAYLQTLSNPPPFHKLSLFRFFFGVTLTSPLSAYLHLTETHILIHCTTVIQFTSIIHPFYRLLSFLYYLPYIIHYTVYLTLSTLHRLPYVVYLISSTLYCLPYIVYLTSSTLYCLPYIVYLTSSTLHRLPYIVYLTLSTLHRLPCIVYLQSC